MHAEAASAGRRNADEVDCADSCCLVCLQTSWAGVQAVVMEIWLEPWLLSRYVMRSVMRNNIQWAILLMFFFPAMYYGWSSDVGGAYELGWRPEELLRKVHPSAPVPWYQRLGFFCLYNCNVAPKSACPGKSTKLFEAESMPVCSLWSLSSCVCYWLYAS